MSVFSAYKPVELIKVVASIALSAVAVLGLIAAYYSTTENRVVLGIASAAFFVVLLWDAFHPLPPKCAPTRRRQGDEA
jgi:hypothetical protein